MKLSANLMHLATLYLVTAVASFAQQAPDGSVTSLESAAQALTYTEARPFNLPIAEGYRDEDVRSAFVNASSALRPDFPGYTIGNAGTGKQAPIKTPLSKITTPSKQLAPVDAGTSGLPFSTARADLDPLATNEQYPFRAAGKLFFNINRQTYICSASLVKPGLVVTAAHCVAKYGSKSQYSGWEFHPGYRNGTSPFGKWTVARAYVLTAYLDGSDPCQLKGVVCRDDVAVLVLNANSGAPADPYPGRQTGWFSYAWNGAGFTPTKTTHVTQLGYPGCLDNAVLMQRNDSQGVVDSTHSDNTVIGSLMCGGSSGGPWLVNFGVQPSLTGTSFGNAPMPNAIIGVASWGSTDNAVKWMGASPFLDDNIVKLVGTACNDYPAACKTN